MQQTTTTTDSLTNGSINGNSYVLPTWSGNNKTTNRNTVKGSGSSNSDIAHNWAHQTKETQKGSNFYFEGNFIYSYGKHFPIAQLDTRNGITTVFFTLAKYSNTTAKHISLVRSASSHLNTLFMYEVGDYSGFNPIPNHAKNLTYWFKQLQSDYLAYNKGRSKTKWITDINCTIAYIRQYVAYFGHLEVTDGNSVLINDIEPFISMWAAIDNTTIIASESAKERAKQDKQNAARNEKYITDVAKFRNFELSTLDYHRDGNTLLRYNAATKTVESSKGIKVGYDVAIDLYRRIKIAINKGGCTNCNIPILSFTVREITDSYIVAGCHTITMTEIEQCYELLSIDVDGNTWLANNMLKD